MSLTTSAAARRRVATTVLVSSMIVAGVVTTTATPASAATVVTNTYNYTGTTPNFQVPAGVTSITVTLKGGQGGRGGPDYPTQNSGGYQGVVTGTIAVTPGQVIAIAVGSGGTQGLGGGSAAGGLKGQNPLPGYDGAVGGISGSSGSSGGGGGGGAATVLQIGGVSIVAGGAGGNGGNGQYVSLIGRVAEDHHVARPDSASTDGRPGLNTSVACGGTCDGGASGAGGGGVQGGDRGDVQYGGASATEWFGFGGAPGDNSTGGFVGLTASYNVYSGNSANGSITISYDDGAPSAPMNLSGTAQTNAVALAWNVPVSNGASPISDYRVEYATSAGGTFTTFVDGVSPSLSAQVTGLTNGTTYYFRVSAINAQGAGPFATTALGIVPSDVPASPTVTGLVPFGGGIRVDFTAGASHAPITGFEYRLDGGEWTTGAVAGSSLTISGLANGRSYSVEIRELNSIGASPASSPASSATPRDVAQAPTAVLATPGPATVSLTWDAPLVDNGAVVTDYVVQTATSVGGTYSTFTDGVSTDPTASVTGLTNGTPYYFRVGAVNAVGTGAWSTAAVATPYTSPNAPSIVLTPGDGTLAVTISLDFNGGSPVTAYEYRVGAAGAWRSTGSLGSSFSIAGLTNGTPYDVVVRATNAAGTSPQSAPATGTPRTVPAAPAISTVALDTGAVDVAFSLGSDGGSALTNVQYSLDGGASWVSRSPASTASPLTIAGLTGGVTYSIALRAMNAAGVSTASNVSSVKATGTPAAPVVTLIEGDRSLTVSFTTPTNGGSSIIGYEYSVNGGPWLAPSSTSSPFVIAGLTNGISYPVLLRAVNGAGAGPSSVSVSATPRTTPSAPAIVGGTARGVEGWIDVAFTIPVSDGGSAITTYHYSTDGGATWSPRSTGTTESPLRITTLSTDGVTPLFGTNAYPVEIRAVNAAGAGLASAVATGITTSAPAAPVVVDVQRGDGAALVRFTQPANGGATITKYEYSLDGGAWTNTGSLATEFTLLALVNGSTHTVEVRAVNDIGNGAASAPPSNFSIYTTPGAPAISLVSPGDEKLTVTFVASASNGGNTVTDHEYSTDGGVTWRSSGSTQSPLVITTESGPGAPPLANAKVYAVQLRAVNMAGPGVASESRLVAPRGVPAAPTGFSVARGDRQLTLSFTLSADGGSPVTAIEFQIDGGAWVPAGSLSSPLTITGLVNGIDYSVAVRATSEIGPGVATGALHGTPSTVPGAPVDVVATARAGQVTASWVAPLTDGGDAIDGYTASVYAQAAGGVPLASCATTTLTCDVTGLANGTAIYVDVVAGNVAGAGPASSPRLVRTPLAAPQVSVGSVSPSATELSVGVAVLDGGGAPITAYQYQLDGGSWINAGSATSPFTILDLVTGQSYSLRIRAISAGGTGTESAAVMVIPHSPPTAPLSFAAASAPASAVLTWALPASDGGQPVTDYVVQYATNANGPFTSFADGTSTTRSATVTGLTNSTAYVFRVAAINTAGTGPWSSLSGATPLSAPSAPTIGTIVPGSSFLSVPFTAPVDNGGAAVTGYQYRLDGGTWTTAASSISPIVVAGLSNGQTYAVELRAVNSVGGGTASNSVSAKPFGLPFGVDGFRATPGVSSVTLDWDAVDNNGSPIIEYNIIRWSQMTAGSISQSLTTTATTYTVPVSGNGTYYFTIEATNAAGTGPRSAPRTTAIVGNTVPSAPTVTAATVNGTNVSMSWTAGAANSSPIASYLVQYSTGTTWVTLSSGSSATSAAIVLPSATAPYTLRVAAVSATGLGTFAVVGPPIALSSAVTSAGATSADFAGSVNANGATTSIAFEYATSSAQFGTLAATVVAATPATATGVVATPVAAQLAGLSVGTVYLVRLVATSGVSTAYGATQTFTTDAVITTNGGPYGYTGSPVSLVTVTSPGGLALERTYVGVGGTTYPSSSTAPTKVGTYSVDTTPADNAIGGHELVTITIAPKQLTASIAAADRAYDGTTAVDLSFTLGGVVSGDVVLVDPNAVSARFADADAADGKVVTISYDDSVAFLTGADAANYTFAITPGAVTASIGLASQTLSFTSIAPSDPVVGETYSPVATSSAGLTPTLTIISGDVDVCTLSASILTFTGAGTCVVEATRSGDANHLAAASIEQSLQVVDVPGRVEDLAVTEAAGTVTVMWTRPVSDGGSSVTAYDVSVDGVLVATLSGSAQSHAVTGLTDGTTYEISVAAVSDAGIGVATTISATPFDRPGSPTVSLTTGNGQLEVSWTAAAPNGRPVTAYHVYVDGVIAATVLGSARSHTLTGLESGRTATIGVAAVNLAGEGTPGVASAQDRSPVVGRYVPLSPRRLLDTRDDGAKLGAGSTTKLHVAGSNGVPTDATAMELNLTVTGSDAAGFITVYPCATSVPTTSNLNWVPGDTISNRVVASLDTNGDVCVFTSAETHLVIDMTGAYSPTVGTAALVTLTPQRLLDTRKTDGKPDAGSVTRLSVTGLNGVPADATAVTLNVTVTEPDAPGFITVYPCEASVPKASNVNFAAGQSISNTVVATIGAEGSICVYTSAATHLVIDENGAFSPSVGTAWLLALHPRRVLDTRTDGTGTGAGSITKLHIAGEYEVPINAIAVTLNITATGAHASGFMTVYPCGTPVPTVSNLNFIAGQTIPNSFTATIGAGGNVCVYTSAATHLAIDLNSAYEPTN